MPATDHDQGKGAARPAGLAPLEQGPARAEGRLTDAPRKSAPESGESDGLLRLQQAAGNAAISAMLAPPLDGEVSGVRDAETRTTEGLFKTVHESVHLAPEPGGSTPDQRGSGPSRGD